MQLSPKGSFGGTQTTWSNLREEGQLNKNWGTESPKKLKENMCKWTVATILRRLIQRAKYAFQYCASQVQRIGCEEWAFSGKWEQLRLLVAPMTHTGLSDKIQLSYVDFLSHRNTATHTLLNTHWFVQCSATSTSFVRSVHVYICAVARCRHKTQRIHKGLDGWEPHSNHPDPGHCAKKDSRSACKKKATPIISKAFLLADQT